MQRYTNKELEEVIGDKNEYATLEFIRTLIVERKLNLNPYAPLYKALKHAEAYITNERNAKQS